MKLRLLCEYQFSFFLQAEEGSLLFSFSWQRRFSRYRYQCRNYWGDMCLWSSPNLWIFLATNSAWATVISWKKQQTMMMVLSVSSFLYPMSSCRFIMQWMEGLHSCWTLGGKDSGSGHALPCAFILLLLPPKTCWFHAVLNLDCCAKPIITSHIMFLKFHGIMRNSELKFLYSWKNCTVQMLHFLGVTTSQGWQYGWPWYVEIFM